MQQSLDEQGPLDRPYIGWFLPQPERIANGGHLLGEFAVLDSSFQITWVNKTRFAPILRIVTFPTLLYLELRFDVPSNNSISKTRHRGVNRSCILQQQPDLTFFAAGTHPGLIHSPLPGSTLELFPSHRTALDGPHRRWITAQPVGRSV